MISLAVALLLGLADAQVELSARQNDAQFERRQTVKKHSLQPYRGPPPRSKSEIPSTLLSPHNNNNKFKTERQLIAESIGCRLALQGMYLHVGYDPGAPPEAASQGG